MSVHAVARVFYTKVVSIYTGLNMGVLMTGLVITEVVVVYPTEPKENEITT